MIKEQEAELEKLKTYLEYAKKDDLDKFILDVKTAETILSMLKEKDKKIEYYKKQKKYDEQFKHELLEEIRCLNLDKDEKDKQIDLMAERIEWLCKTNGILLDKEHGINFTEDDVKQYFERKVKK